MHSELDTEKENDFTVDEARVKRSGTTFSADLSDEFVQTILGNEAVDFNEFNVTVFDQISNSYQKFAFDPSGVPTVSPRSSSVDRSSNLFDDLVVGTRETSSR